MHWNCIGPRPKPAAEARPLGRSPPSRPSPPSRDRPRDAATAREMNAFRRLKKEIALSRPPEDDLSRLSYGELWAGVPPPEFVGSCGGARCTNGTCPQCSTSADEQRAALKRCGDRYKREECCVLCEKSGSVQVTVRDGETIHGRRTVAISLVGSPRACQFCRAEMEAATGWRDPGRCTGFGEADCPYKAGRQNPHELIKPLTSLSLLRGGGGVRTL